MTRQEEVAENLLLLQVDFLERALSGSTIAAPSAPITPTGSDGATSGSLFWNRLR